MCIIISSNVLQLKSARCRETEQYMGQSIHECIKFFKGCLPQILLGPFLNTLSHI